MSLVSELETIVAELDASLRGEDTGQGGGAMPDFVTTRNGQTRDFTRAACAALWRLSGPVHANRPPDLPRADREAIYAALRGAVGDLHSERFFEDTAIKKSHVKAVKTRAEERVAERVDEYTHSFPAWTIGLEHDGPIMMGPATIMTRKDWVAATDFPPSAIATAFNAPESNARWKEIVLDALNNPHDKSAIEGLPAQIYGAIRDCRALVRVTVSDYEIKLSQKLAALVAKSALDCLSLGPPGRIAFLRQALTSAHLPPFDTHSLIESDGFLRLPGWAFTDRFGHFSPEQIDKMKQASAPIVAAAASALYALVPSKSRLHPHPQLAQRWLTALDWFADGNREQADSIALVKLGTSLDVLANGGRHQGILRMASHILRMEPSALVVEGEQPLTLDQLVAVIYNDGRSQILHGNHYDRLKSFATQREQARQLASVVLVESILALHRYEGEDFNGSFEALPLPDDEDSSA